MPSPEYSSYLKKSEEYAQKAADEPDALVRRALEAVAREYDRRAENFEICPA
jgi:hypothetical protein